RKPKKKSRKPKKKSRKPKKKSRKSKSKFNMKSPSSLASPPTLKNIAARHVDAETFGGLHVPTYSQSYLKDAPKRVHPVAGALAGQIMEARPQVSSGALQSKKLNTVLSRMLKVSDFGPSFHELGRADHYGSDLGDSIKEMIRLGAFRGCGTSKKEGCWLPVVFPSDLPMPKLGEESCEHMIMETLNDRNIFPDSLKRAGEWSVLAKDAWKMSAVLRAECFVKEIFEDDNWVERNYKLLALYHKMVSYEINNNPSMQVGDWVWVYPGRSDRQNYSLGRISAKQTTPKEYAKIKLRPDVNVKTLKRLGIKPVIKTIVTYEGENPARDFPAFVREALMAKGNPIMIRSLQPMARPHRSDMSYEAAMSILGPHAYDGDSD
ncbi:MAG: hypothetical protein CMQ02_10180, partial [Gammaproteobacteria bacterium]|nr:hypothetical protein [Gammaproteobacteria bacterium]